MRDLEKYLKTFKNRTRIPILNYALVKDKTILINNIDKCLLIETERSDEGLIEINDLLDNFEADVYGKGDYMTGLNISIKEEYPDIAELDLGIKHLKIKDLKVTDEIKYLKNFCDRQEDEKRPFRNCLFFDPRNVVATQTMILKVVPHGKKNKFNFVVDAKKFAEIPNGIYDVYVNGSWIFFIDDYKTIGIYTNQINYPNYPVVIPDIHDTKIGMEVDRQELIDICEVHLSLWEKEEKTHKSDETKKSIIKFNVSGLNNTVNYFSELDGPFRSSSQEIKKFSGNTTDFTIGFDIEYLLRCLKGIKQKEVLFAFFSNSKPVLINRTTLIMPIMLNN